MLDALRFVQGAVAKKDFAPALTHFLIENGRISGYNGRVALSAPIALDITAYPKAVPFVRAIEACRETVVMHMTPTGRLAIKSGNFKAFIECYSEPPIIPQPDGEAIDAAPELLEGLRLLSPFVAEDASRPWARGVLLDGETAFATNNIILIQYWHGVPVSRPLNVPIESIDELLRVEVTPEKIVIGKNAISFLFSGDRWLRSQLYSTEWPSVVGQILDKAGDPRPWPEGFFDALERLSKLTGPENRIYVSPEGLATSDNPDDGASIALPGCNGSAKFNRQMLSKLEGVATSIDLSVQPAKFEGNRLRGVISGMR